MNVVVISAAISSANSNLYLTTRMLLSLARSGFAPAGLAAVGGNGVPFRALAVASTGVALAILLALYAPAKAFLALYGTAVAGMLFIWVVILITFLRFRGRCRGSAVAVADQDAGAPRGSVGWHRGAVGIAMTTFFVDGLQVQCSDLRAIPGLVMSVVYARRA